MKLFPELHRPLASHSLGGNRRLRSYMVYQVYRQTSLGEAWPFLVLKPSSPGGGRGSKTLTSIPKGVSHHSGSPPQSQVIGQPIQRMDLLHFFVFFSNLVLLVISQHFKGGWGPCPSSLGLQPEAGGTFTGGQTPGDGQRQMEQPLK
jgi:hypothetical protein